MGLVSTEIVRNLDLPRSGSQKSYIYKLLLLVKVVKVRYEA